jgi:lipopolysaccharide/colanic/teichoic acid biosynthesis glycosyltransferase
MTDDADGGSGDNRRSPIERQLENLMAVSLLILTAPILIILALLIKLQDGGPVLYRGKRLGRHKEPFFIYKFRTLVPDAEQRLGGQLNTQHHGLETPIGSFLRESRLDELPQLINILTGDMVFLGPRPERPAVYEAHCRHIPGYDRRFNVYPGILGHAQLFTPHAAPKRLRAAIDALYGRRPKRFIRDIGLILLALMYLAFRAVQRGLMGLWRRAVRLGRFGTAVERRTLHRVCPKGVTVRCFSPDADANDEGRTALLADINSEAMRLYTGCPLPTQAVRLRVTIRTRPLMASRRAKTKTAYCDATIKDSWEVSCIPGVQFAYVVYYQPLSELNRYIVDKYLLGASLR